MSEPNKGLIKLRRFDPMPEPNELADQFATAQAQLHALDLKWAAASEFIRDIIEALGQPQPPSEAIIDLPKLALYAIGQIEELKVRDAADQLATAQDQINTWRSRYQSESLIVDNVWGALGISTYEQAQGKHIATLVSELRCRTTAAEQALAQFRSALKLYGRHNFGCASQTWDHPAWGVGTNEPCNCGLDKLLAAPPPAPEDLMSTDVGLMEERRQFNVRIRELEQQLATAQAQIQTLQQQRDDDTARIESRDEDLASWQAAYEKAQARAEAAEQALAQLLGAAKDVIRQFEFIKRVQHNQLVRGQALESASKNWEGLGNEYIEFQGLIDAIAVVAAPPPAPED